MPCVRLRPAHLDERGGFEGLSDIHDLLYPHKSTQRGGPEEEAFFQTKPKAGSAIIAAFLAEEIAFPTHVNRRFCAARKGPSRCPHKRGSSFSGHCESFAVDPLICFAYQFQRRDTDWPAWTSACVESVPHVHVPMMSFYICSLPSFNVMGSPAESQECPRAVSELILQFISRTY